ncbi:hypothetical protein BJV74DRAFT_581679 [Russula compacta]|nr:hypothetical protein BJV74DRAFT_581679 [Russula compacta]
MLKTKSSFAWDDAKGMNVTPERRLKWDELVKSNADFELFAKNGWPHYEALESLMRGRYAHRGTQLLALDANPLSSPSSAKLGPSLSSPQYNAMSSYSPTPPNPTSANRLLSTLLPHPLPQPKEESSTIFC